MLFPGQVRRSQCLTQDRDPAEPGWPKHFLGCVEAILGNEFINGFSEIRFKFVGTSQVFPQVLRENLADGEPCRGKERDRQIVGCCPLKSHSCRASIEVESRCGCVRRR